MKATTLLFLMTCAACSEAGEHAASPGSIDFSLDCRGTGRVEIMNKGQTQAMQDALTRVLFRWDGNTCILRTEHVGDKPTPLCASQGQEDCSVQVSSTNLTATSLDIRAGKVVGDVSSTDENIDVDLASLAGTHLIRSSLGTLTNTEAKIVYKMTVTTPLRCNRVSAG